MVLHLLGTKSWNVYNRGNVERVRRDEAEAAARHAAAERRVHEHDAQRRLAILRGDKGAPRAPDVEPSADDDGRSGRRRVHDDGRERKRRRLRGEDDTDRDIRCARQAAQAERARGRELLRSTEKDAPLQDHAGNIQLFPAPLEKAMRAARKNEEAGADTAKQRRREEDGATMRFRNAAGDDQGVQQPWYASADDRKAPAEKGDAAVSRNELVLAELPSKDVWGNDDARRREREQNRMASTDPFAAMQQAQGRLKQRERDKERWQEKQQAAREELEREQRREKERRRRRGEHGDSPDRFSLHAPGEEERDHGGRGSRPPRHRSHHRRGSRSSDREHRHRRGSRSRSQQGERHGGRRHRRHRRDGARD